MAFRTGWEILTVGRLDMAKRLWIWLVWDMEPEVFRVWKEWRKAEYRLVELVWLEA